MLLFAFLALALFWRLGCHGLTEPDEGRTAGTALELHESGTWLVPRLYDLAQFNKPPLTFWACAVAYKLFGANEWAARLPTGLAALGTLLLTRAIARRLYGPREALAATLILLTAPMFFIMARIIDPNMMLACWTTLALWAAVAWMQDGRAHQRWIFWIAFGLAFLTKGPPAFALIGVTLLGFRIARRVAPAQQLAWRPLFNIPALLVGAVIGLGWYVIAAAKHPELWRFFIVQEIFGRLTGSIAGRAQPFWFFVPMLLGGLLPWVPVLVAALARAVKNFRTDDRVRLLLLWTVLPFVLFSSSSSKLPAYVLPLLPPLAILAGAHAATVTDKRWFRLLQIPLLLLIAWFMPAGLSLAGPREFGWEEATLDPVSSLQLVWTGPALLIGACAFFLRDLRQLVLASTCLVLATLGCLDLIARHENQLDTHSSPKKMCAALKPHLRPGDRVVIFRNAPRGVYFYLRHPLTISDRFEPELSSDRERLADRLYHENDPGAVYRHVDHEPRVFVITSPQARGGLAGRDKSPLDFLRDGCRKPLHEIYRDDKYAVLANVPVARQSDL